MVNILYTSREQVAVYKFNVAVTVAVPLLAIFFQSFVAVRFFWLAVFDLPLLVTIFFAVARRNQVSGLLTGGVIGIIQDSLTHHPLGIYGIAKTVIGYVASSLGVKLDVENPGSRMLMTFVFYLAHQLLFFLIARGMAGEVLELRWGHLILAAVANAVLAVPVFAILDRLKARA